MADKSIYAPDEESQRKYQEALDRVTASLDARKNRLFDRFKVKGSDLCIWLNDEYAYY